MVAFLLPILARLSALWRWLASDPTRLVIALLIALSAFLGWRLSAVDGDRDKWRTHVREMEVASKAVREADKSADLIATEAAKQAKGEIDASNERARAAARDSSDPLRDGLDSLRAEGRGSGDKAAR